MAITFQSFDVATPRFRRRETVKWIRKVAGQYDKKVLDIAFVFCSDAKILEVNRQYLNHDYYTDVITFDYSEQDAISGDIFISLDTVRTNAEQFHVGYDEELMRVIIHGVLHLCGLKDKSVKDGKQMKDAENKALVLYQ